MSQFESLSLRPNARRTIHLAERMIATPSVIKTAKNKTSPSMLGCDAVVGMLSSFAAMKNRENVEYIKTTRPAVRTMIENT